MRECKAAGSLNMLNYEADIYFNGKNTVKSLQAFLRFLIILTKHNFSFNNLNFVSLKEI